MSQKTVKGEDMNIINNNIILAIQYNGLPENCTRISIIY